MTLSRRRFLTIAAAFAASPACADSLNWSGHAFGADVSVGLVGPDRLTRPALAEALSEIRRIEALFSLYDPASALSQLNRHGTLRAASPDMLEILRLCDDAHRRTGGRFDPTVQPLWRALAEGRAPGPARDMIGWHRVRWDRGDVFLDAGQALTFNGIAQGYAADRVLQVLRARGLHNLLVDVGELASSGPVRKLGVSDPVHGLVGTLSLRDAAVATSSPNAMPLADGGHILGPRGEAPRWSTVSVIARSAALADALSTGLCLAPADVLKRVVQSEGVHRILAVDSVGNLRSFGAAT